MLTATTRIFFFTFNFLLLFMSIYELFIQGNAIAYSFCDNTMQCDHARSLKVQHHDKLAQPTTHKSLQDLLTDLNALLMLFSPQ